METLSFEILGIPFAKQSFRFTKAGLRYQPAEIRAKQDNVRVQIINQLPKGFKPFTKKVEVLAITFVFPPIVKLNKHEMDLINKQKAYIDKTTKPDLTDNLMKGIFDAMEGIVYVNDGLICKVEYCAKVFGSVPGTFLKLRGE